MEQEISPLGKSAQLPELLDVGTETADVEDLEAAMLDLDVEVEVEDDDDDDDLEEDEDAF